MGSGAQMLNVLFVDADNRIDLDCRTRICREKDMLSLVVHAMCGICGCEVIVRAAVKARCCSLLVLCVEGC